METVQAKHLDSYLRRQAESALERLLDLPEESSNQNGFLAEMAAHEAMLDLFAEQGARAQYCYEPTTYESEDNRRRGIDAYLIPVRDIVEVAEEPQPTTSRRGRSRTPVQVPAPKVLVQAGTRLPIDWALASRSDSGELTLRPGKEGRPWVVPLKAGWFIEVEGLDDIQRVWILRPENLHNGLIMAFHSVVSAWLALARSA